MKENVLTTKRTSMLHLQKMCDLEFVRLMQSLDDGKLKNTSISLKVDGAGARFGKDVRGRPFFEGSRTGPIFEPKSFTTYVKGKGITDEAQLKRASHYDDMFDIIVSSAFVERLPNDTKVIVELFYNPMGEETKEGIKFVSVSYDKSKIGNIMTIFPFSAVCASNSSLHPNRKEIVENLYVQSNKDLLFIDPLLDVSEDIDLSSKIAPLFDMKDSDFNLLVSRKTTDKEAKTSLKCVIQKVKEDVADFILNHKNILNKFKLGQEIEGLVLNIEGQNIKITTHDFKAHKVKKQHE